MPPQPTTLQVHGRDVTVESTPLSIWALRVHYCVLRQPRPNHLVVRPSLGWRLVLGLFWALGSFLAIFAWTSFSNDPSNWWSSLFLTLIAGMFILVGSSALFYSGSIDFDRESGQWRYTGLVSVTKCLRLSDILAAQILAGHKGWQLNLILAGGTESRFNLTYQPEYQLVRKLAVRLTDFLGVTLLDQIKPAQGLRTDGGEATIHTEPLGAGNTSAILAWVEPRPGVLVLRPHRFLRCIGLGVGLVVPVCSVVRAFESGLPPWGAWKMDAIEIGIAFVFGLIGLLCWLGPSRHEFDLERRLWSRRGIWRIPARPLSDLHAVQLIPGDYSDDYRNHQVNLVLNDPVVPRFLLCEYASTTEARKAGVRLAAFLGVPLFDQLGSDKID